LGPKCLGKVGPQAFDLVDKMVMTFGIQMPISIRVGL
jgi:hypothetical protein